ncbi:hypothetical protein HDU93_003580 [Gonapodya sp. JEL0774]|nr:hypothetical protein HDU93_003580 [Gonapodya sp. JEL0774]
MPCIIACTEARWTIPLTGTLLIMSWVALVNFPKKLQSLSQDQKHMLQQLNSRQKPFIAAYRASLTILTCISILAVDFMVFPRKFAKTETYGPKMMQQMSPSDALLKRFFSGIRAAAPPLVLGIGRILFTKSVNYQVTHRN